MKKILIVICVMYAGLLFGLETVGMIAKLTVETEAAKPKIKEKIFEMRTTTAIDLPADWSAMSGTAQSNWVFTGSATNLYYNSITGTNEYWMRYGVGITQIIIEHYATPTWISNALVYVDLPTNLIQCGTYDPEMGFGWDEWIAGFGLTNAVE